MSNLLGGFISKCHSCVGRNPLITLTLDWIPACAGMTNIKNNFVKQLNVSLASNSEAVLSPIRQDISTQIYPQRGYIEYP